MDPTLGELGHGDLKVVIQSDSLQARKSRFSLEWIVDGVVMDRKPVFANQEVEYGNEPTPGAYQVNLRLDKKTVASFNFRITK